MHGLVHPQPLVVGPGVPVAGGEPGHLLGTVQAGEGHETGAAPRLHRLEQGGKREPGPGHIHRPALDAAEVVDALLVVEGQQVIEVEGPGAVALPGHFDRPRHRPVVAGKLPHRPALSGEELVEVVVRTGDIARHELLPLDGFRNRVAVVSRCREDIGARIRRLQHLGALGARAAGRRVGSDERGASHRPQDGPPVEEEPGVGDLAPDRALLVPDPLRGLDEMVHWYPPQPPPMVAGPPKRALPRPR